MNKKIISIIIPVINESKIINETIEKLLKYYIKQIEIIVVDGEKKASTLKVIKNNQIIKIKSKKNRGIQMNEGAKIAKGEILLFLHSDTILPNNAFSKIKKVIYDKKYMAGAFILGLNSKKFIYRIIEQISTLRTKFTGIPYGDQAIFINKKFFFDIGAFKEYPIMEDVDLMQRVKKEKNKIYIIPDKVLTSTRRWEKEGLISCTLRNWFIIILYFLGKSPEKLVKYYK